MKSADKFVWRYLHMLFMYEFTFERNLLGPLAYDGAESVEGVCQNSHIVASAVMNTQTLCNSPRETES
jgi:hypothetical protein